MADKLAFDFKLPREHTENEIMRSRQRVGDFAMELLCSVRAHGDDKLDVCVSLGFMPTWRTEFAVVDLHGCDSDTFSSMVHLLSSGMAMASSERANVRMDRGVPHHEKTFVVDKVDRIRIELCGDLSKLCEGSSMCDQMMHTMWRHRESEHFYIETQNMKKIPCHRSVLAASSPAFKAMLESECQEGWMPFINIDEPVETVEKLLEYLYRRQLPIGIDCSSLLQLLRLGDLYQIDDLVEAIIPRLLPLLSRTNVVETVKTLRLLRNIRQRYGDLYSDVQDQIASDRELLEELCMSAGEASPLEAHRFRQSDEITSAGVSKEVVNAAVQACSRELHPTSTQSDSFVCLKPQALSLSHRILSSSLLKDRSSSENSSSLEHASNPCQPRSSLMPCYVRADTYGRTCVFENSCVLSNSCKRKTRRGGRKRNKTNVKATNRQNDVLSIPATHCLYED